MFFSFIIKYPDKITNKIIITTEIPPEKIIAKHKGKIEKIFIKDKDYIKKENVETIVIGEPKDMQNNPSESSRYIEPFIGQLKKALPDMTIKRHDERFTSKMAFQTMIDAGLGKKQRQNKALVDTISATIILQSYMESEAIKKNRL